MDYFSVVGEMISLVGSINAAFFIIISPTSDGSIPIKILRTNEREVQVLCHLVSSTRKTSTERIGVNPVAGIDVCGMVSQFSINNCIDFSVIGNLAGKVWQKF